MTKFAVGDRVAVYGHHLVKNGHKGTVQSTTGYIDGTLVVVTEGAYFDRIKAHPKQCRRLKKRPAAVCFTTYVYSKAAFGNYPFSEGTIQSPQLDQFIGQKVEVKVRGVK